MRIYQNSLGLSNTTKRTRKRDFLDSMALVFPWSELISLTDPYAVRAEVVRSRSQDLNKLTGIFA